MKKIIVGMSGGVDSSVAAALLAGQGYDVHGVFIEAYNSPIVAGKPGCRTDEDKRDAIKVAAHLGISFEVLDLKKEYEERVINYFVKEYEEGRTPNPDVVCNGEIKFGLFLDYVLGKGFEYLATGHYARIAGIPNNQIPNYKQITHYCIKRPKDLSKDQTYFLWKVNSDKLDHVIFPLGELTKQEVREKARKLKLPNANKPDSMGICMMGELSLYDFLKNKIGEKEGDVIWNGEVVGKHKGSWFYTIGQRGGWEIRAKIKSQIASIDTASLPPLFVTAKNMESNKLFVGTRDECMKDEFMIVDCKLQAKNENLLVRIRNLGELVEVRAIDEGLVKLKKPVFAPAPGQSAVFYTEQGVVAGGGIIC